MLKHLTDGQLRHWLGRVRDFLGRTDIKLQAEQTQISVLHWLEAEETRRSSTESGSDLALRAWE